MEWLLSAVGMLDADHTDIDTDIHDSCRHWMQETNGNAPSKMSPALTKCSRVPTRLSDAITHGVLGLRKNAATRRRYTQIQTKPNRSNRSTCWWNLPCNVINRSSLGSSELFFVSSSWGWHTRVGRVPVHFLRVDGDAAGAGKDAADYCG